MNYNKAIDEVTELFKETGINFRFGFTSNVINTYTFALTDSFSFKDLLDIYDYKNEKLIFLVNHGFKNNCKIGNNSIVYDKKYDGSIYWPNCDNVKTIRIYGKSINDAIRKKNKLNMIHSTEKLNFSPLSENKSNDLENKFIDELIEKLIDVLSINYKDRTVVKSLFRTSLSSFLNSRSSKNLGLLQQYENAVLEKAIKRLKTELNVPEDIGVNFDYATHAKYRDFIDYIKNNSK